MPFAFHYAARSDVGMVRSNNEDSGYAGPHLLAMADGMGGHAGGDVASSTVVAALVDLDGESLSGRDASQALLDRIREANREIGTAVDDDPRLDGMGTTLIAMLRAIAYGWKQEALARNAQEISELGRELHERLSVMAGHWAKVGKNLGDTPIDISRPAPSMAACMIPGPAPVTHIHPASARRAATRRAVSNSGSSGVVRAEPKMVTFGTSRYGANTRKASPISVTAATAIFRSTIDGPPSMRSADAWSS